MRDTNYATELATAVDAHGQRIERLHIKEHDRPEIRFSWWPGGSMANRPLDLPEGELLDLLEQAFEKNVFTPRFEGDLLVLLAKRARARTVAQSNKAGD